MEAWTTLYPAGKAPGLAEIAGFIANPLWEELRGFIEESYGVSPMVEYSKCSGAPGWNVKYKKGGRALCTLYPQAGAFTCMISIGRREAPEAELLLPGLTPYLQNLYQQAQPFNGGRWLMIDVTEPAVLPDVKALLHLRVRPSTKP